MKNEKMDRRVKYTKKVLKEALVELIQEQHISNITVKDLCETADVNRSTFYAHYSNPYDLLHQMEEEVICNVMLYLEEQRNDMDTPMLQLTNILVYAKNNTALFAALLSENCDYVFQKDILELSQVVSSQYNMQMDNCVKKYLEEFGAAGCISVFKRWMQDGFQESPDYISDLLMKVLQWGSISFNQ
ncbi:MAG: TetR/AcrR family transcriptional regulator [Velocimicrobium sp.]